MLHIRLSESDRERLGAPEVLEWDESRMMAREAAQLFKVAGMTVKQLRDRLKERDPEADIALVWLALRRAGVEIRYSTLDFDLSQTSWTSPVTPEPDAGDAEGGLSGQAALDAADEGNSGAHATVGTTPNS